MENIKIESQNIIKIETDYQGLRSALQQVEGVAKSRIGTGRKHLELIQLQLKDGKIKLLSSDTIAIIEASIMADYPEELEGECFYFKPIKLKSKKDLAEIKIISDSGRMEIKHISSGDIEVVSLEDQDGGDMFAMLEKVLGEIEESESTSEELNFDQNLLNTALGKYKGRVTIRLLKYFRMFVKTLDGTGAGFTAGEKETQGVTIRVAICGLRK